jgi:hypothetical protein
MGFAEKLIVKALRAKVGDFRDWQDIRAWAQGIAETLQPSQEGMKQKEMR